ncbi:hypothetical protein TRVL_02160 [Trypanosoma vivax]|nr:hypothetical protein TRVL_02160 [Trypanosoma vivax]
MHSGAEVNVMKSVNTFYSFVCTFHGDCSEYVRKHSMVLSLLEFLTDLICSGTRVVSKCSLERHSFIRICFLAVRSQEARYSSPLHRCMTDHLGVVRQTAC